SRLKSSTCVLGFQTATEGATAMRAKKWTIGLPLLMSVVFLVLPIPVSGAAAQEGKVLNGGKAEEFKGKTFDIKAKGTAAIKLTFPADKKATVTVRSKKETDVNLFVLDADKKVIAKDESPGPSCDLTFTPKTAGPYLLEIRNLGPGDNQCTLKVEFGKKGQAPSGK